jgi:glycosyltransferase involved in cell wall biosynthesis
LPLGNSWQLTAWKRLQQIRLKIVGTGPLETKLRELAAGEQLNVEFTGMVSRDDVQELIRRAEFVVVPSEWYEGFPLVIAESYACATPVLAARIGGLTELVRPGATGDLFDSGNPESLASRVNELLANPNLRTGMRRACRAWFDEEFNEQKNVETLLGIYARAAKALGSKASAA